MTADILTVLAIVVFSGAVIALCWLFEGVHRRRDCCACGHTGIDHVALAGEDSAIMTAHLTAVCPLCRFQKSVTRDRVPLPNLPPSEPRRARKEAVLPSLPLNKSRALT